MAPRLARIIDVNSRRKLGRNDPCHCGSGKKYKKCCLSKDEARLAADRPEDKSGWVGRLVDWAGKQPAFQQRLTWRLNETFGRKAKIEEGELNSLVESLLFEEPIGGKTAIERFLEREPLTAEERTLYERWRVETIFSFFRVLEVELGRAIRLEDLANGLQYRAIERTGSYQVRAGEVIVTRLLPYYDNWMLGGGLFNKFPAEMEKSVKQNLVKVGSPPESIYVRELLGRHHREGLQSETADISLAKTTLDGLLVDNGIGLASADIIKRLADTDAGIDKFLEEVTSGIKSQKEAELAVDLVMVIWQNQSEQSGNKQAPGLIERRLVGQMMNEIQPGLLKHPATQARVMADRWMNKPLAAEGGQTPLELIRAERRALGNPEIEPSYEFSVSQIGNAVAGPLDEVHDKLNRIIGLIRQNQHLPALRLFAEIGPDIDHAEDPYRAYNNLGVCLVALGEVRLAKKAQEKSLAIRPNYEIAKRGLALFENDNLLLSEVLYGRRQLLKEVTAEKGWPEVEVSGSSELANDAKAVLRALSAKPAALTKALRQIRWSDAEKLNSVLTIPDPLGVDSEKMLADFREILGEEPPNPPPGFDYSAEWQLPKVRFLHLVMLASGWLKEVNSRLVLSRQGERALIAPDSEVLNKLLLTWLVKMSWQKFDEHGRQGNAGGPVQEMFRLMVPLLLERMADYEEKMFSSQTLLAGISGDSQYPAEAIFADIFTGSFFDYLAWAGIITIHEPKRGLIRRRGYLGHNYQITGFGRQLLDRVKQQMAEAIPEEIKQMLK